MYNILICDDQPDIVNALKIYLSMGDYQLFEAYTGRQAVELVQKEEIHLILMDIMMPEMDGIAATQRIREFSNAPIILLTAKSENEDKVLGLNMGADDYITKPFSLSLLYAKVTALIRRDRGGVLTGDTLRCGDLEVSLSSRRVRAGGRELSLTPKEYSLLTCLMRNRNMVMSREQLLVKCWGYDYEGESRAVDTHIRRLREKLGPYGACIKTVIKAGYKLEG